MPSLTDLEWLHGRNAAPLEPLILHAGPLMVEFEQGDLRYLRWRDRELIRRIYVAVRDANWNTIPGDIRGLTIDAAHDHFRIRFESSHRADDVAFDWLGTIDGRPDGSLAYTMDGTVRSRFRYGRIGFCILHPVETLSGRPYRAMTPAGPVDGTFGDVIEPQAEVDGCFVPITPSFSSVQVSLAGGTELTARFEGDLFEVEDQRNWTDGSFKTYCTPGSLGYPFDATPGEVLRQRVELSFGLPDALHGRTRSTLPTPAEVPTLQVGEPVNRLPRIGFGLSSSGQTLSPREAALLRVLRPAHIRVDLHLGNADWRSEWDRGRSAAEATGSALEVALFLGDDSLDELAECMAGARIARFLVFHEAEASVGSTSSRWLDLARRHLAARAPGVPFAGGTSGNFAEVNRDRPDPSAYDALSYTINPQVHAKDERSMVEGIDAQGDTVRTARTFMLGRPIVISAVTLRPPYNQAATVPESRPDAGELPPEVDPRQPSLFAAAWTVGSLRSLANAGVAALTYFETIGWRGLVESERGSALPDRFRSMPGMIFPVYHVFAAIADLSDPGVAEVLGTRSSRPLELDGVALRTTDGTRILAANLTPRPVRGRVTPLPDGPIAIRRINVETARAAAADPAVIGETSAAELVRNGAADLELGPYEVVRIDSR